METKHAHPNLVTATAIPTVPIAFENRKELEKWLVLNNCGNFIERPSMDKVWRYTMSIDAREDSQGAVESVEHLYLAVRVSRGGKECIELHRLGIVTWAHDSADPTTELPASATSIPLWVPGGVSVTDDGRLAELTGEDIQFTSVIPASITLYDIADAIGIVRIARVQTDAPAEDFAIYQNGKWWR